jgi:hypothetical protein
MGVVWEEVGTSGRVPEAVIARSSLVFGVCMSVCVCVCACVCVNV